MSTTDSQKARMQRGDLYLAAGDEELATDHHRGQALLRQYNSTPSTSEAERDAILRRLLGHVGERVVIRPPFQCDYGSYIHIGAGTFVNVACVFLDVATITIGEACQIGPMVQIYTADHPRDAAQRRAGLESASPVTIGDNVWLGGGCLVLPGVTVGNDAIVGAGAVVTRDVAPGRTVGGNPARVLEARPS